MVSLLFYLFRYLFIYSDACYLVPLMLECDPVSLGVLPVNTAHPAMSLSVGVSLLNVAWRLRCQGQWSPRGVRLLTPCGLPNVQTAPLYYLHSACRMNKDKSPLTISVCFCILVFFLLCPSCGFTYFWPHG